MLFFRFIPIVVLLNLLIPTSYSKTPDGVTPADETICDPIKSATPGLYGLCVSYCEAMDGPELISGDFTLHVPKRVLLEKYEAKMEAEDPPMPCVSYDDGCPVWDRGFLASLDENLTDSNVVVVVDDSESIYGLDQSLPSTIIMDQGYFLTGEFVEGNPITLAREIAAAYVVDQQDAYYGVKNRSIFDTDYPELGTHPEWVDFATMELTEAEYTACKNQIEANVMSINCPSDKTLNVDSNRCE